jgi:hypothetical protein
MGAAGEMYMGLEDSQVPRLAQLALGQDPIDAGEEK